MVPSFFFSRRGTLPQKFISQSETRASSSGGILRAEMEKKSYFDTGSLTNGPSICTKTINRALLLPAPFFCLSPNGDKNPVAHDLHAGCRCRAEGAHAEKADRRSKKMPAGVAGTIILIFVLLPCRGDENDERDGDRRKTTGGLLRG